MCGSRLPHEQFFAGRCWLSELYGVLFWRSKWRGVHMMSDLGLGSRAGSRGAIGTRSGDVFRPELSL
jgi:hypothetical protein